MSGKEIVETKQKLGVYEESDPLKRVLMWGPPGPEAVIAQVLPEKISCFLQSFDVTAAIGEYLRAESLLRDSGVEVISVKKLLAEQIRDEKTEPKLNRQELKKAIVAKTEKLYKEYESDGAKKEDMTQLDSVGIMLEQDIESLGEREALVINEILSLSTRLPMANVLYARDQSNLAGSTFILSSMRHEIRQPEVKLYNSALKHSGILGNGGVRTIVQVSESGKFEGGDGIPFMGSYYIGLGGRSDWEGIKQIAPVILANGIEKIVVARDRERSSGKANEMDAMHLDTIWMPSGADEVVACMQEVERRQVFEITLDKNGGLRVQPLGSFEDYMSKNKIKIVPITKDEQDHFAPNFLNLGNNHIILSLEEGSTLSKRLGESGKRVETADLINITKGYGGLHCMTAPIERGE